MFFVLVLHVGGFIFLDEFKTLTLISFIGWFIEYLAIVAVNCFVLITGYLHCIKKNCFKGVLNLWFEVFFYSVGLTIAGFFLFRKTGLFSQVSKVRVIFSFFSVFRGQYWFFTEYCGLFVLVPVLNIFVNSIDKETFKRLLVTVFLCFSLIPTGLLNGKVFNINNGYSTLWFVFLYLCGSYIKFYGVNYNKVGKYLVIYIITALLSTIIRLFLDYSEIIILEKNVSKLTYFISNYNQPLIFSSSVCLFLVFLNIRIKGNVAKKIIKFFAPLCFSVYLIHLNINFGRPWFTEDNFAKMVLFNFGNQNLGCYLLVVFGVSAIVFIVCCSIDYLRFQLFRVMKIKKIISKLSDRIDNKFKTCI